MDLGSHEHDDANPSPANAGPDSTISTSGPAELEQYMKSAYLKAYGEAPDTIFRQSRSNCSPQLKKNIVNRIILFRGSFNPPHYDHKLLLTHTFLRTTLENLIAAIIVPSSVEQLKQKLRKETKQYGSETLILSRMERATLWQDDTMMQWAWVYNSAFRFDEFKEVLIEATALDGFRIEFVPLVGGRSALYFAEEQLEKCYQMPNILVGDVDRGSDIFGRGGKPKAVQSYGKWSTVQNDHQRLVERIASGLLTLPEACRLLFPLGSSSLLSEAAAQEMFDNFWASCGPTRLCYNDRNPQTLLQLIPIGNIAPNSDGAGPSSTKVREVIRDNTLEQLADPEKGLMGCGVLNWESLMNLLRGQEDDIVQEMD